MGGKISWIQAGLPTTSLHGTSLSEASKYPKQTYPSVERPLDIVSLKSAQTALFRDVKVPLLIHDMPIETVRQLFPGETLRLERSQAWTWRGKALGLKDNVRVITAIKPKDTTRIHDRSPEQALLAMYVPKDGLEAVIPAGYDARKSIEAYNDALAFGKGRISGFFRRVARRYGEYIKGAGDTLSQPKNMGFILASLGVTSITLSAVLYGMLYLLDYGTVEADLHPVGQKGVGPISIAPSPLGTTLA